MKDLTAVLPDGKMFEFWEKEQKYEKVLHVDCNNPNATDSGAGEASAPFKTINAAAQVATPGTQVLIHAGVYRETVQPAMSGEGPDKMIGYEAAGDGEVIIKASVEVNEFKPSEGWSLVRMRQKVVIPKGIKVWEIELNPDDYRGYNPFCAVNIIHDRLFIEYDKTDMTSYLNRRGMVFIDGKPMKQVPLYPNLSQSDNSYWVEANGQKIHIRLKDDDDPKNHVVELSCREQCFAPKIPFLSYIKVKGITAAHASMGAPVPQRGAISAYRGHHWVIEDCTIDWANAVGIDLGNECWHHSPVEGQIKGYSTVRRCVIKDVGVCGIAVMGSDNLLVEDTLIEGTGWQRMELSWEAGGIKVHHAVDALIRRNVIRKCYGCDALWMDVGNHNCRITSNIMIDGIDSREHIFMECTRDGEDLIDNNILWNVEGRYDRNAIPAEPGSSGWYKNIEPFIKNGYGIYLEGTDRMRIVNNLIGNCNDAGYFAKVVAFRLMLKRGGTSRENKFFGNIFHNCGDAALKLPNMHNEVEGNAYSKMPPGFLRVIYPEPEMCLDLPTWQEFCGFDMTGSTPDMEISIDGETLMMEIEYKGDLPKVKADEKVKTDYFGGAVDGDRIAGPFPSLDGKKVSINVDPRKLK